jgi:hypothetical protein
MTGSEFPPPRSKAGRSSQPGLSSLTLPSTPRNKLRCHHYLYSTKID